MKVFVLAMCCAGLASAPALAAEMDFTVIDADQSGLVSIEEAAAAGWTWTAEQFSAADADADGFLNPNEFQVAAAS